MNKIKNSIKRVNIKKIGNYLKEHRTLPILTLLAVGLTFGLSRLVLADTVTLKYKDEYSNTQSLTLNKGSTIYLDPNLGYFKKDNDQRTKKITLTSDLNLANNDDVDINPYTVAKQSDPKEDLLNKKYAWGKNTTFSRIRTMQEMNSTICSNETTPTKEAVDTTAVHSTNTNLVPEARLKDTRDNKYYTVRKLADGNCWMTDNLAYAKVGTLSPADSDVQDESFSLADSDIYTKEGERWQREDDKKFIFDRPDPVYSSTTKTSSSFTLKGWRKTRLSNGNISLKAIYNLENLYGNLYTWYTATAGTGTYSMSSKGTNASSSICPRGWRLPPNDGTNSYKNLLFTSYDLQDDEASFTKMRHSPLDFSFASYYDYVGGQVDAADDYGFYWSSTAYYYGNSGSYYLTFRSGRVHPHGIGDKVSGRSVRCVAR